MILSCSMQYQGKVLGSKWPLQKSNSMSFLSGDNITTITKSLWTLLAGRKKLDTTLRYLSTEEKHWSSIINEMLFLASIRFSFYNRLKKRESFLMENVFYWIKYLNNEFFPIILYNILKNMFFKIRKIINFFHFFQFLFFFISIFFTAIVSLLIIQASCIRFNYKVN